MAAGTKHGGQVAIQRGTITQEVETGSETTGEQIPVCAFSPWTAGEQNSEKRWQREATKDEENHRNHANGIGKRLARSCRHDPMGFFNGAH